MSQPPPAEPAPEIAVAAETIPAASAPVEMASAESSGGGDRDEKFVPLREADPVESGDKTGYDEDQWQRSMADTDLADTQGEDFSAAPVGAPEEAREDGSLPSLDELLEKIPATSQELVETLFSGRFVSVQKLDRDKLF